MNRTDIFYFAPAPISAEIIRDAARHAAATTNISDEDTMFNVVFPVQEGAMTLWTRFDPNKASELGSIDREDLVVWLEREVRFGICGEKIRDPALPATARFLGHLLQSIGGFVGFDTDGWEPIFTSEDLEEFFEFMS